MQPLRNLSLAVSIVLVAGLCVFPAYAEDACPEGALGVSRTIEVDTTGGPWIGSPHGDPNLLAPGEVVLTFDDGPSPKSTRQVLDALAKECTKAVFFMVGEMAVLHPEVVKEVAEQGHTIGTHTWTHPNLARLDQADVTREVEATFDIVQKASPVPVAPFFRYPYLSSSKENEDYFKSRNIAQFAVDIDSSDWRVRRSAPVITRVMAGLKARGRGIILMHDIHGWTADAVPELLAKLKAGGYKVVLLKPKTSLELVADISPPAPQKAAVSRSRRGKHQHAVSRTRRATLASKKSAALQ